MSIKIPKETKYLFFDVKIDKIIIMVLKILLLILFYLQLQICFLTVLLQIYETPKAEVYTEE